MMTEHLSIETIDLYRRNALGGKERLVADMHIADCSICGNKLGEAEKLLSAFNAIQLEMAMVTEQTIEHPDDEQLSDLINKRLNDVDAEIITSHLAWCSLCLIVIKEMEAFGQQFETGVPAKKHNRWPDLPAWVPAFFQHPSFALATKVITALVLVSSASYVLLNWQMSGSSENQTAKATQPLNSTDSFASPSPIVSPPAPLPLDDSNKTKNIPSNPLFSDLSWVLPAEHQLLSSALRNGEIEAMNDLSKLRAKAGSGTLLGGGTDSFFALLSPAGKVIRENRPTLKWQPYKDAVEYKVLIVDSTSDVTLPTRLVRDTEYKLDSSLESGHDYTWQIVAQVKDGDPVYGRWPNRTRTHAEFRVLDTNELKLVQDAEKNYQPDKDPMGYLALAVRYAKAGLIEDAERMLKAYLKERPSSPQVVKMLNSLKRQSGSK